MNGQVIVNADDFGMTPGVNRAITKLHDHGRLTSVSIMVNMPWSAEALSYAQNQTGLRTGIHLNLSTGRPVLPLVEVPSLVNHKGDFWPLSTMLPFLIAGRAKMAEVEAELSAQIETFLASGMEPHHMDTHLHFHSLPTLGRLVADLSQRYNAGAVRNPELAAFVVPPHGPDKPVAGAIQRTSRQLMNHTQRIFARKAIEMTKEACNAERLIYLRWCLAEGQDPFNAFQACLNILHGETLEIIAHPAERDDVLPSLSDYVDGREREMDFLSSDGFAELLVNGTD